MPDLFELDRLAALAQQDLDTQTAIECRELATAAVEAALGKAIISTAGTWEGHADDYGQITLPLTPVSAVASVTLLTSAGAVERVLTGSEWELDNGVIRLLTYPSTWPYRARVAYTYGSDDLDWLRVARGIAMRAALRLYTNPETLRSESILGYSRTSALDLADAVLTSGEIRQLRARYGYPNAYSVSIGLG